MRKVKNFAIVFVVLVQLQATAQLSFSGTEFWINSCDQNSTLAEYNVLRIIGDVATLGNVSIPGTGFSQDFCFNSGGAVVDIELPDGLFGMTASNVVQNNAIHITTDNNVMVVFFPIAGADSDYYIALPTSELGNEYFVNMPKGIGFWNPSYTQITATQNGTNVSISNPTAELGPYTWGVGNDIGAGSTTSYTLNLGESVRFQAGQDDSTGPASTLQYSGTRIASDKPVFVSGTMSTVLPASFMYSFSDGLRESLLPRYAWGNRYFTTEWDPGVDYLVQVVSADNANTISLDGVPIVTLNASEMFDTIIAGPHEITATHAIGVVQSSLSKTYTSVAVGDPSSFNLLSESNFNTTFHDVNAAYGPFGTVDSVIYMITVPTAAISTTTVNGTPISPSLFSPIGITGYSNGIFITTTPSSGSEFMTFSSSQPMMVYKTGLCRLSSGSPEWQVSRNLGSLNNIPNSNIYDSSCALVVLPIDYISFEGERVSDEVHLDWSTSSELRNDYFEVQRSANGFDFQTIGAVQGAGTTTETSMYSFVDESPINSMNYYRLKQVDLDGLYSYSNAIAIEFDRDLNAISLYPNPANTFVYVDINGPLRGTTRTRVVTLSGQVVVEEYSNSYSQPIRLNIETLKLGTYFIEVHADGEVYRSRFIKK